MAETIQQMIARKKREREEGVKPKAEYDNKAALKNLNTEVSTAKRGTAREYNPNVRGYEARATISMQDEASKGLGDEESIGQKLLKDRQRRAKAKEYIEKNSK